ncbi:MAG: hypothetical protein ACE5FQ_15215, partial [Thiogranum sp.]
MPEKKPDKHPEQWLAMLIRLSARLPLPVLYLMADSLFVPAFYLLRFQRELVENNLQGTFPDRSRSVIRKLAASSYRNTVHMLFTDTTPSARSA